jgi:hypothetical protein
MAIVFPASPTLNDTFTAGFITYKCVQVNPNKWIGLGVTPADRLVEGSNSLEITAGNDLVWTGDRVGLGTTSPTQKFDVRGSIYVGDDIGINDTSPDNKLHITTTSSSAYSTNTTNTSNLTNALLKLQNLDGGDGTGVNNYVGIQFSVANGATSTAQLQYVRTGDNSGKFEFKARNTSSSYPNIMTLLSDGSVGIKTEPTTNAALDVMQGYYSIMYGATNGVNGTRPDNTNKEGRVVQYHRDNEEEPLGAIVTFSQSNAGKVYIGGGSSLVNAATETALYAASNYTTTGGTKMLSVTTSGVTANELFTVTHPDASSADTALFQNTTSGGDNRVRINVFANGGGDPYLKFDAGGSNFIVGEQYNGTTNNQLLMGVGETPTSVVGFGVDGNGKTWSGTHLDGNGQFSIRNNASSRHTSFELSGDNLSNYKMIRASGKYITRGTSERNFDIVNSGDTGTNVNILIEVTFMLNSAVTNHAGSVTARAGYHRSGGGNFTFWTNTPSVSMYNGSGYGAGSISWVGGGTNVKTLRYSTDSNTNYTNYVIKELIVTGYDLAGAVIL